MAQSGGSTTTPLSTTSDNGNVSLPDSASSQKETPSDHGFGPSGPSDALLASLVNGQARRDDSLQGASITSSCVTSGTTTPVRADSHQKGKQRQTSESQGNSTAITPLTTTPAAASTSTTSTPIINSAELPAQQASINRNRPEEPASARLRIAPHSTAESERRLAVLDRAIATVLFLLLALVLRRILNAVS
jgi:hypothetical protein